MSSDNYTAYLAAPGFEDLLCDELSNVVTNYGRLVLAKGPKQRSYWALNIWYEPHFIPIKSISDAVHALRALQRNWWPYEFHLFRRIKLIHEKLPHVSAKPLNFLDSYSSSSLGSFTLIDTNTLLASPSCSSPMPNGEWHFNENINAPSRAYLKLWELFTRFGFYPKKDEICIDLGASPGGWTWVLASLAYKVIAFDRAYLDPRLQEYSNIEFHQRDAFKINIKDYSDVHWILSDIICYPDKLYDFVVKLLDIYPQKNYVFTIKLQGDNYEGAIRLFEQLPGTIIHLSHNKHELCWFKINGYNNAHNGQR
jgi:23S rRNA (cytidine2498-2'-O)-methyltransferase